MKFVDIACASCMFFLFCFAHFSTSCIFILVEHHVVILELTKIYLAFYVYYIGNERPKECVRFESKEEKMREFQRSKGDTRRKTINLIVFILTYHQQRDVFEGLFVGLESRY